MNFWNNKDHHIVSKVSDQDFTNPYHYQKKFGFLLEFVTCGVELLKVIAQIFRQIRGHSRTLNICHLCVLAMNFSSVVML